ncbi:DUF3040 domain-containing protein [Pseudonocardia adelaidensis]|uniref:DUF3040 family protein n=1 Tax=Pseudonocardia adelaidensis TaxID=648754 RepID=A0ABP9NEE4_9PSEU
MPVGAGGEALRRIEAALVADDPRLAEAFRKWHEPPGRDPGDEGFTSVGRFTGLVPLLGLAAMVLGPIATVAALLVWAVLFLSIRRAKTDPG